MDPIFCAHKTTCMYIGPLTDRHETAINTACEISMSYLNIITNLGLTGSCISNLKHIRILGQFANIKNFAIMLLIDLLISNIQVIKWVKLSVLMANTVTQLQFHASGISKLITCKNVVQIVFWKYQILWNANFALYWSQF